MVSVSLRSLNPRQHIYTIGFWKLLVNEDLEAIPSGCQNDNLALQSG